MSSREINATPEALHATYEEGGSTSSKRNSVSSSESPKHRRDRRLSKQRASRDGAIGSNNQSAEMSPNHSNGFTTSDAMTKLREHLNGRTHESIEGVEEKLHAHHTSEQRQPEPLEEVEEIEANAPKYHIDGDDDRDAAEDAQQQRAAEAEAESDKWKELNESTEEPEHAAATRAARADDEDEVARGPNAPVEIINEDATAEEWREIDDAQRKHHHPQPSNEYDAEDGAAEQRADDEGDERRAERGAEAPEDAQEAVCAAAAPEEQANDDAIDERDAARDGNADDAEDKQRDEPQAEAGPLRMLHAEEHGGAFHTRNPDDGADQQPPPQQQQQQPPAFAPLARNGNRDYLVHPDQRNRHVVRWNAVPFDPRDDSDDEMELSTCMAPVYEDEDGAEAAAKNADGDESAAAGQDNKSGKGEYKNGKPRCTGEVTSCFAEPNLLYRIISDEDKSWAFYNDTLTYEMHVRFIFGKHSKLEALGDTKLTKQDDGSWLAETIVDPTETQPFVRGRINGFTSKLHAVPLTEDYHKSCRDVANATIDAEVQAIRRVCDSRNAEVVLRACLINNLPFVDPEFPPRQASLDTGAAKPFKPLAWARPATYLPAELANQVRLFRARPAAGSAIAAGDLGDSWLLCAISCVSEEPQRLVDLFRHPNGKAAAQREHALGAYRVTICKHGWWRSVLVDDYLPVSAGKPKFAHSARDAAEIWPCIIEKAFAKLHGSYGKIIAGDPLHALTDLTGFSTYRFDDALSARGELSGEFFDDLMRAIQSRYTVVCSTPGKDAPQQHSADAFRAAGLLMGHAYTIIDAKHFPEIDTRLVKLRNAWQREIQWTGEWANGDARWEEYPEVADACGIDGAEADKSGDTFWMPWEAVQKYFTGGGVCFSHAPAYDYRLNCAFNDCVPSTVIELDVQSPTWLTFSLSQEDKRCRTGTGGAAAESDYQPVMISIASPADDSENAAYRVIYNSTVNGSCPSSDKWTFLQARDVSLIYKFEPGKYIIVPRLMPMENQAQQVPFVFGIVSNREVGAGEVAVSFRRLAADNRIFENFPKFEPELLSCSEVQYQKKLPGAGFPQTQMGLSID